MARVSIPDPVVAAITGHALGGGFVLALYCDYRVASNAERAKFACSRRKQASTFRRGPAEIIRHELPLQLLRRLALSCERSKRRHCARDGACPQIFKFPRYREVKAQINGPLATLVGRLASQGRGQAQYWRHRAHPSDPL
jgi:enoyl-CoA hydratase